MFRLLNVSSSFYFAQDTTKPYNMSDNTWAGQTRL